MGNGQKSARGRWVLIIASYCIRILLIVGLNMFGAFFALVALFFYIPFFNTSLPLRIPLPLAYFLSVTRAGKVNIALRDSRGLIYLVLGCTELHLMSYSVSHYVAS